MGQLIQIKNKLNCLDLRKTLYMIGFITLVVIFGLNKLKFPTYLTFESPTESILMLENEKNVGEQENQRTTINAEIFGPVTIIPKRAWATPYTEKYQGYKLPLITTTPNGRLGNVMGEYATMYALQKSYDVSIVLIQSMANRLNAIFKSISIPIFNGKFNISEWKRITHVGETCNFALIEVAASGLLGPHPFVVTEWSFETQLFHAFSSEILQEFTFKDNIMNTVNLHLEKAKLKWQNNFNSSTDDLVFVGFHIRRTDYFNHIIRMFGGLMPGEKYFVRAMQYYTNKFPKLMFIVASDDPKFIEERFSNHSNAYVSIGLDPPTDMAFMSSCNHSIVTLGSFGFWGAYLAGGEVVYPVVNATKARYTFSRPLYEEAHMNRFTELPID